MIHVQKHPYNILILGFNITTTKSPRCNIHYFYWKFYLCRTTSANRSLPDIPKDKSREHEDLVDSVAQDIYETTEPMGDHSELYATVQDAGNIAIKLIKM